MNKLLDFLWGFLVLIIGFALVYFVGIFFGYQPTTGDYQLGAIIALILALGWAVWKKRRV